MEHRCLTLHLPSSISTQASTNALRFVLALTRYNGSGNISTRRSLLRHMLSCCISGELTALGLPSGEEENLRVFPLYRPCGEVGLESILLTSHALDPP